MPRKKRWLYIVLVIALLATAGGGYYYYTNVFADPETEDEPQIQTTRARRGDLVISATGAGTVIPAIEIRMGVETGGLLTELNVQTGDRVQQGDVLAKVDDLNYRRALASAELQLAKAELDLETTRQSHQDLLEAATETAVLNAKADLATAQESLDGLSEPPLEADIAEAEAAVASALEAYQRLVNGPDSEDIERAQMSLDKAKNSLWSSQMSRDARGSPRDIDSGAYDQAQVGVLNGEISVRQAELDLSALREPASVAELQGGASKLLQARQRVVDLKEDPSEAAIANAEAKVAQAKEALDDLLGGPSDDDVAISAERVRQAELSVNQAQLSLEVAKNDLDGTTLVSPLDGTILLVSAEIGERVGDNAPFITVADLNNPMLEIFVDETDMDKIAVGYEVEVVLDALPDQAFKGRVTQVDPSLVRESNVDVIRGLVALDADSFAKPGGLPMGLNATVDVIGGRAENAVLVPVEALRELDAGQYAVFVVEDGKPRLRIVEVGLQDFTYAEIRSGLREGETVSTGIVETR